MDPVEFFKQNADLTARPEVYRYEIDKCAEMIGWKEKWHKRGDSGPGPVKRGLGMSMHTWGGRPHDSTCEVRIEPDGGVSVSMASQDLGVGTYTTLSVVAAETLGLEIADIQVNIGSSKLPISGASGGSTTVGGTSASTRRATVNALEELKGVAAESLGVAADDLVAKDGTISSKSDASKSLSWKEACKKLGNRTITGHGKQPDRNGGKLNDSGVGGVQMADVSVDVETGIVTINKITAVQDVGLVICLEQCESQVYGSLIQGVGWALYEESIYDQSTGKMLNADMEFYKLAGAADIGELEVHMVQNKYDDRGVIGIGEPPAISPGAAISNAVANAIGVRVPTLPLTPDRVLAALAKA
jgi:xanthine dehydrogenase YagR molybdenum-binding subunit